MYRMWIGMQCKYCESEAVVKNGTVRGEQVFKCKA